METTAPEVAAFDLDGTLTGRDTVLPFLCEAVGMRLFLLGLPALLPSLAARGLGLLEATPTKELLFTRYLRGRPLDEIRAAGQRFACGTLPRMLRPAAVQRLRWHQERGHRCFVVTASPDLYVAPWAESLGVKTLGSGLEADAGGRLTGRHQGAPCEGPEKLRRLIDAVGGEPFVLHA
ncbi:HAD-IB family hydrolase, partial [Enterovirga sp.]|uniref:HAD-IB family hydrolase n=1 Tax=Enterovirga sp. TaxID=2026350 RepID=UPI002C528A00